MNGIFAIYIRAKPDECGLWGTFGNAYKMGWKEAVKNGKIIRQQDISQPTWTGRPDLSRIGMRTAPTGLRNHRRRKSAHNTHAISRLLARYLQHAAKVSETCCQGISNRLLIDEGLHAYINRWTVIKSRKKLPQYFHRPPKTLTFGCFWIRTN